MFSRWRLKCACLMAMITKKVKKRARGKLSRLPRPDLFSSRLFPLFLFLMLWLCWNCRGLGKTHPPPKIVFDLLSVSTLLKPSSLLRFIQTLGRVVTSPGRLVGLGTSRARVAVGVSWCYGVRTFIPAPSSWLMINRSIPGFVLVRRNG